jgi:hypothetical protein
MRNELFIERYANERHQAHLSEAAHDRRAGEARAPAQRSVRHLMRSGAVSILRLSAALIVLARPQLASHIGRRVPTRALADER